MKPRDLTDLALRNLREAILRNVLTTLGVAVGVASLVAMLSLGVGLQQLASRRLSQSGLFDTIFVTPKNSFRGVGRAQREMESDKPPRPLDEGARKEFEKLPNVIEVFPQIRFFTEVRFNNKPYATVVAGLPESSRNSGAFDGMQGNFFSSRTKPSCKSSSPKTSRTSLRPCWAKRSRCATPSARPFPRLATARAPLRKRQKASPSCPRS